MTFILNETNIILFVDGKPVRVAKTDSRYPKLIKFFDLPKEEQLDYIKGVLSPDKVNVATIHGKDGFEIVEDNIFYKGQQLPTALAKKIRRLVQEGVDVKHFEPFWENLSNNPSSTSVSELMDFLEYKELPITEDGHFLAYKGVNSEYFSIHGNSKTVVIRGIVDEEGRIYNGIGEIIEVQRRDVDDDRRNHCSHGLHVGSLDYARSFGHGGKLLIVKVNPQDVVSVPEDSHCQKCRVAKYEVISEFVEEITVPIVDEEGTNTFVGDVGKERNEFIDKIDTYLTNKSNDGYSEVTIRQIQSACSPKWPSKESVLEALQQLGYLWYKGENDLITVDLD